MYTQSTFFFLLLHPKQLPTMTCFQSPLPFTWVNRHKSSGRWHPITNFDYKGLMQKCIYHQCKTRTVQILVLRFFFFSNWSLWHCNWKKRTEKEMYMQCKCLSSFNWLKKSIQWSLVMYSFIQKWLLFHQFRISFIRLDQCFSTYIIIVETCDRCYWIANFANNCEALA